MKSIFSITLFLLTWIQIYSQNSEQYTFTAIIKNEQGQPLEGATVILKRVDDSKKMEYGITNAAGKFIANDISKGSYRIFISFVGYKNIEEQKEIRANVDLTFKMELDEELLDEVVVKTTKPYITGKGGKLIVNVTESPLGSSGNFWETLKYTPMIVTSTEGSISVMNKSAVVYMDGKEVRLSGNDLKDYLSGISSDYVDTIEIMDNPGASYGADIGAVVHIKTKKMRAYGYRGSINSFIGSREKLFYGITTALNIRGPKYFVKASFGSNESNRILDNEIVFKNADNRNALVIDRSDKNKVAHSGLLDFEYDIQKNITLNLKTELNVTDQNRKDQSRIFESTNPTNTDLRLQQQLDLESTVKIPNLFFGLKMDLDSVQQLKFKAQYLRNKLDYQNTFESNFFIDEVLDQRIVNKEELPHEIPIYLGSIDYNREFLGMNWETGIKYTLVDVTNTNRFFRFQDSFIEDTATSLLFNYNEKVIAMYLSSNFEYKGFDFSFGLRSEHTDIDTKSTNESGQVSFENNYTNFFPSVAIQHTDKKKVYWSLSYRKTIVRPDYAYLNPYRKFNGNITFFQGDTNINPQINHDISMVRYHKGLALSAGLQIPVDFISTYFRFEDGRYSQIYQNFDNVAVYYTYLGLTKKIKKWWNTSTEINAFYANADVANIEEGPFSIGFDAKTTHSISFGNHWRAAFSWRYQNAFEDGFFFHGDYSSLDMSFSKKIPKLGMTFSLSATDILKTYNERSRTIYDDIVYDESYYNDRFSVNFRVRWNFGKTTIKTAKKLKSIEQDSKNRF